MTHVYESEYRKVNNTISRIYREERNMKWATVSWTDSAERERHHRRKENFEPYVEPFRPFNKEEIRSIRRGYGRRIETHGMGPETLISYQAVVGGFTTCNIVHNNKLFTGSSHCIKTDRWLPIRGKMHAFHRALQSEGVEMPTTTTTGEK